MDPGDGLAACSSGGGGKDACQRAFDKLQALNIFGGSSYGTDGALAIGMACQDLTKDDLACIDKAKGRDDLDGCTHAREVTADRMDLMTSSTSGGAPADPAALTALADAMCACKDVTCLVRVGEHERAHLETVLRGGKPADPSAVTAATKMRACVDEIERSAR